MTTTLDTLVAKTSSFTATTSTDPTIQIKVSGDTQPRFEVDADGQLCWGAGSGALQSFLHYTGGFMNFTTTSRGSVYQSLRTGAIISSGSISATSSISTGTGNTTTGGSSNPMLFIGINNVAASSAVNRCVMIGDSNSINATALNCLVAGSNNVIAGTSNIALGDAVSVTTSGTKNVGMVSGKIFNTSNYCAVIGDATINGASQSCFTIGCTQGTIAGRRGVVLIGDDNTSGSGVSPGGNNMLQMRFNGGGLAGNTCYYFSTDVNSNGVKINYQGNSWLSIGSDARLKNKVSEVNYSGVLEAFEKVPIYRYTYKHDKDGGCDKNGCTVPPILRTGFFANEYNAAFGSFIVPQYSPDHPYHTIHPEDKDPIHTYAHDDLMFMNFCGIKALTERVKKLETGSDGQMIERVERLERNAETVQLFKGADPEVVALQKKVDVLTKTLQAILKNPKMLLNSPELLKYVESNGEASLDDGFTQI
nr:hypothetical protein K-LCC10_0492 [Kaumoebavirus]